MTTQSAKNTIAWLLAFGLASGLSACGADPDSFPVSDLERQTFDLVNGYRAEQGLPALTWDGTIGAVCRGHSQDMAAGRVEFSHAGFDDRVAELGRSIDYQYIAENVHHNFGYDDPAQVALEGWINSPGHQVNMVGDYELSGMGVAEAEAGEYYFTQIFVLLR